MPVSLKISFFKGSSISFFENWIEKRVSSKSNALHSAKMPASILEAIFLR